MRKGVFTRNSAFYLRSKLWTPAIIKCGNRCSFNIKRGFATKSSVVEEEVRKFDKLSKEWWDPQSKGSGPLHSMNPVRVRYIQDRMMHYEKSISQMKMLDVGCGGGLLSEALGRIAKDVTGVDAAKNNIEIAKSHLSLDPSLTNINYRHTTAEALLEEGLAHSFDVVCALEVIEHVNDPRDFIHSCLQLVKPGGSLFISTMNRTMPSFAVAIVAAEYVMGKIEPGTHHWDKFVTPDEISAAVNEWRMPYEVPSTKIENNIESNPGNSPDSASPLNSHTDRSTQDRVELTGKVEDFSGLIYNPALDEWYICPNVLAINYISHIKVTGKPL